MKKEPNEHPQSITRLVPFLAPVVSLLKKLGEKPTIYHFLEDKVLFLLEKTKVRSMKKCSRLET